MSIKLHKKAPELSSGFTLIEILIISPILIIVISGLIGLLVTLTTNNLASNVEMDIMHDAKTALGIVEDDINLASKFLTTKEDGYGDPYGPRSDGGPWSYKGTSATDRVLLARAYSTTQSIKNSNKTPVYINKYGCGDDVLPSNPVLSTNTIFFVRNGNLYKRILTSTVPQTLCNTQFQLQSCPSDAAPKAGICKTDDILLVSGVTNFDIRYYANSSDSTPMDVYNSSDPTALDAAKTIDVNLTVSKYIAGKDLTFNTSIKVSKMNE